MLESELDSDEVKGKVVKKTIIADKSSKKDEFKEISVVIDANLANSESGKDILLSLQSRTIPYEVQTQQIPFTISLIREVQDAPAKFNFLLVLWTIEEFLTLHASEKLLNSVEEIVNSSFGYKLTLLIHGNNLRDKNHLKLIRKNKLELEMTLAEVQLKLNVQYRFVKTTEELGNLIIQYAKAFAELPHKLERNKKQECVSWFAEADSKECVRVDADGNGLFRLWEQQLQQFSNIGFDIAQAIASKYNSPQSLMNAYDNCVTREDAEMLLRDIPVRRVHEPLNSVRKIGPEMSKKVFAFFNNF